MIRVGVVGAAGRMGATVCDAVHAAEGLELVAAVDTAAGGPNQGTTVHGVTVARELRALADAGAEVVVDFTVASAARDTLPWLALHGMHAVVGTTGFSDADMDAFRGAFTGSNCLVAANFAIGAVLMMRFAEQAAPRFAPNSSRVRAVVAVRRTSACTRCDCGAWSPTRRSSWGRRGRRCRSATIPTTAIRSCRAWCSRAGTLRPCRSGSPSGSTRSSSAGGPARAQESAAIAAA